MPRLVLHNGDCVEVLKGYADGSIGAIVSDPPYGLSFMGKDFDKLGEGAAQREWHRAWVTEAFRVLCPGGVIKAFSGSRTFHHLAYAVEQAGFVGVELEAWTYGSGFPKSLNIGKAIQGSLLGRGARYSGRDPALEVTQDQSVPGDLWDSAARRTMKENSAAWSGATVKVTAPEAQRWEGWGTALKPAWEPVVTGRKPA